MRWTNIQLCKIFIFLWLWVGISDVLLAQESSFWRNNDIETFSTGGSLSFTASAYTVDGIENRRAPGMIQTNANLNFTVLGLSSGIGINYSTDESGLRQNMNTFHYNAGWRWLVLQVGDMNTRFSSYGLSGATVRGGYIRATPGDFLVELIGGRSKRAVRPSIETGFREPAFEQWSYGAKVGYGRSRRSYFFLSSFYSRDSRTSLNGTNLDIDPRENLTLTPDFQVRFWDGRITIASEATASVFTNNLNSSTISFDDLPIPGFLGAFYTPRSSSRINYAGNANIDFVFDMFSLGMGYERIQPGFESLGSGRIRDDIEKVSMSPTIRFLDNRVSVSTNISHSRDNLLGNRFQTQQNTGAGANIQYTISENLSLNTSYNLILNRVKPDSDDDFAGFGQTQTSHNLMLMPNLVIMAEEITHNISITAGYLTIASKFDGEGSELQDEFLSQSYTGGASYSITLPSGLTLSKNSTYMRNDSDDLEINNYGLNLGASYALFDRTLTLSLNSGLSMNRTERAGFDGETISTRLQQINGASTASYRLTSNDTFSLNIRTRNNRVLEGSGRAFTELEGRFQYQRRF
ncbi:MAG: hypothetical protein EA390_02760 [Balneolaceae bacterium]|nr:MAG: hypothetical protein EA390_02760 [Balneolaceae bacterium]